MLGTFGLPFMARLSVGASWASPSSDQKRRVAQAYGRYTTAVYATRFEFLGEQKIKRGGQVSNGQSEWRAGIDQFRAARQRHSVADPGRLSRQRDQRAGCDAGLHIPDEMVPGAVTLTGLHDLISPIDARAEAKGGPPRGAAAWSSR